MLKVYTVFDSASNAYGQPFYCLTKGMAIRSFTDAVNEVGHPFSKYPAEFKLFELADYDESTGLFSNNVSPIYIGSGHEFIKS